MLQSNMFTRRTAIIGGIAASTILIPSKAYACPKTFRVIVSLADNKNQGLVPIKASLGNGQNPANNLYWGAMYGVKSYLKRQDNWKVSQTDSSLLKSPVLESLHLNYKNGDSGGFGFAEAWDGAHQKQATEYFMKLLLQPEDSLTIFVGHNPLMDVDVDFPRFAAKHAKQNKISGRKFAVIGCQSRSYFEKGIEATGHTPYVLTAGNMAPEAYVVEAIIRAWMEGKPAQGAREYAAAAYAKYQKIPLKNANWLFGV